jgi:ferredoxin-2, mitochondrial
MILPGACGGVMACSTCHVILPKEFYDRLPEKCMEEEDMLDLAWGVTETWVMCDDLTFRNI